MRPKSIRWFGRLYLASTLLWLIDAALAWQNTRQTIAESPQAAQLGTDTVVSLYVGLMVAVTILTIVLWYFAAQQRAVAAKWIVVACFAIGLMLNLPGQIGNMRSALTIADGIDIAVTVLTAAAVAMLFRRDAVAWFRNGR